MHLYLLRHAHAEDGDPDAARPLSEKGRKQIRRLGRLLLGRASLDAGEFWHSPLVRSRDTAKRLARKLGSDAAVVERSGLKPDDDPFELVRRLNALRHPVVIVGHDPHLSTLATLLVTGEPAPLRFRLKKSALLRLDRHADGWSVAWLVSPDLL